MRNNKSWVILVLIIACLVQIACAAASAETAKTGAPVTLDKPEGAEFNRVILTEKAAQRIDVQTDKVREEQIGGKARLIVPYSSIIYGLNGETWVYTSPEPLTFERAVITVDYIEGDNVVLLEGPAVGTAVATVAVAELYGADTGVGK